MLSGRPNDKDAGGRNRVARHNLNKGAGIQIALDEMIREPRDAEPGHRSRSECGAVVRFEAPLRMDGCYFVAVHKLPGFHSLHEGLMGEEFVRRLGSAILFDVVGTCDERPGERPDPTRDQVRSP